MSFRRPTCHLLNIYMTNWSIYWSLFCTLYFSVEGALAHPYLNSLHDISDEPICMTPFSFDFEQHALTEEQMKELIYRESLAFNPEYQHMWIIAGKIFVSLISNWQFVPPCKYVCTSSETRMAFLCKHLVMKLDLCKELFDVSYEVDRLYRFCFNLLNSVSHDVILLAVTS